MVNNRLPQMFIDDSSSTRIIFENAPVVIVITDHNGKILNINRRVESVFGYTVGELIGEPIESLLPEGLRDLHVNHRNTYTRKPFTRPMGIGMDLAGQKKNGLEFPVEIGLSYIQTKGNLSIICFITDISERKRAEKRLKSSETRFKSLFDSTPDAVLLIDLQGSIILSNKTSQEMLGYSADEIRGKPVDYLIPDVRPPDSKKPSDEENQGSIQSYLLQRQEFSARRKDSTLFPVSVKLNHFRTDGEELLIAIIRDITEQKLAQRELQLLSQIVHQMKDAVILTDDTPASVIQYVNQAFTELYGYTQEEVIGKSSWILFSGDDSDRDSISLQRTQSIEDTDEFRTSYQDRKKDGTLFWASNTSSVIQLDDQETTLDLGIVRDITKQVQYEQMLAVQNTFLSTLHDISLQILRHLDLSDVLEFIIWNAASLVECPHGQIYLLDKEAGELECKFGIGYFDQSQGSRIKISDEFIAEIFKTGNVLTKPVGQGIIPSLERTSLVDVDCIIGVPLKAGEEILGLILVAGNMADKQESQLDEDYMLTSLGQLASIAIQNAQLFAQVESARVESENRKARMERELEIARKVQVALLPRQYPTLKQWSFAALWRPALEVAGDYYDFVSRSDGKLDLIIADVTDKGVPAALFMAHSKVLLQSSLETSTLLLDGVVRANQWMSQANVGPFVTCFLARLDPRTGKLDYVNAGHESPLVYHAQEQEIVKLEATGMPLAVDTDVVYEQRSIQLAVGDFMVFYTDGVPEAINQENVQFGMEALEKNIYLHRHAAPSKIARGLLKEVESYSAHADPSDDIAILVVKRG